MSPALCALAILTFVSAPSSAGNRIGHRTCCGRHDVVLVRGHVGSSAMKKLLAHMGKIPLWSADGNHRGGPYWPTVDRLAEKLRAQGFAPTIVNPTEYKQVAADIAEAVDEGRMADPITLIGYSSGADATMAISYRLNKKGIRVGTLLLIETTLAIDACPVGRVSPNVDYCVNFYHSKPLTDWIPLARGVPVRAKSPRTRLININWGVEPGFEHLAQYHGHLTVADCPSFQDYLVNITSQRKTIVMRQIQNRAIANKTISPCPPQTHVVRSPRAPIRMLNTARRN